ncbi:MFS transporter [Arthrobacter sp. SD76]|uniref:MFS transporter n=1 Tax=Arthrobacter sp. SD76 TaxID=3415007 RepID=UPI003C719B98
MESQSGHREITESRLDTRAGQGRAPSSGLWRSLVVSGAVMVTVDLMYAFVPVWGTEQGIGAAVVGLLLALRAAVSVVSRLGLTRLIRRFGRKAMLIVSIAAAVLSLAALPLVGVYGAIAVMVGLGLGLGIPQPLTMAWVVSLSAASSHGAVLGLRMTVNRLWRPDHAAHRRWIPSGSTGFLGIFWANAALLTGTLAIIVPTQEERRLPTLATDGLLPLNDHQAKRR